MQIETLAIEGAWVLTPVIHSDARGGFLEWFKAPILSTLAGHRFDLKQANCSISAAGVLRGIHYADVPPGQAKYITCVHGAVFDVVVDIRVGSSTFGQWHAVRLDDVNRKAVYLTEGLGHAFLCLEDDSTVVYLSSQPWNPSGEHEVNPLDPAIGIHWPSMETLEMSAKDATAPSLAEAMAADLLPRHEACIRYRASLNSE